MGLENVWNTLDTEPKSDFSNDVRDRTLAAVLSHFAFYCREFQMQCTY